MTKADQVEREVKLGAWPEFVLPDLDGFVDGAKAGEPVRHDLDAVYYDTADLKLVRRGVTLRFRTGEPPGDLWTLKLPSDSPAEGLARREISVSGRRDAVPKQFVDATRAWALGRALNPVARLSTLRQAIPLCDADGRVLATMDDDTVTVRRGRRVVTRFRELEVELAGEAPAELLTEVDKRLRAAGAEHVAQIPKLTRALGREASLPWDLDVPALGSKPTMAQAAQASFRTSAADLVDLHALVVLDAEGSARRGRAIVQALAAKLEVFAELLQPEHREAIGEELGRLAAELARVAELDALLARMAASAAGARADAAKRGSTDGQMHPLAARLADSRARAQAALIRSLRERRYITLLERLAANAVKAPPASGAAGRRVGAAAGKFARPLWRELRRKAGEVAEAPDEPGLSAMEPEVARLDVALELAGDVAQPALERVRELRGLLADHDEALALIRRLRTIKRRLDVDESWAAGVLVGRAAARAEADRARFAGTWEAVADKALWTWAD